MTYPGWKASIWINPLPVILWMIWSPRSNNRISRADDWAFEEVGLILEG
jgi:hypothetical protein